jgi:hypothetical protein
MYTICMPRRQLLRDSCWNTDNLGEIFLVADGTPIIDLFPNIDLQTSAGTNQQLTTLFIQYKHSGLESETSVTTMNNLSSEYVG